MDTGQENPWLSSRRLSGEHYDATYEAREAAGEEVHGEANFVMALPTPRPLSVLDAGCGTGRIAIELARRDVDIVGVDLDSVMLDHARTKAPHLDWRLEDLSTVSLGRTVDVILMAGNVMIYLTPGTEEAVVANMARHLAPGGFLVAGFQLRMAWQPIDLPMYDAAATRAGLTLYERWATWERTPWHPASTYALSVHQREAAEALP